MTTTPSTEAKPLTRRERLRRATVDEIKTLARRQLAEAGPGGLSLRAITREMGMSSSALYRYFSSQDDLVSALIVDAYHSVTAAMVAALGDQGSVDQVASMSTVFHAHRQWTRDSPSDFALIFGTPVPGYQAPAPVTGPAAGRYGAVMAKVYAAAVDSGAADPARAEVPESIQLGEAFSSLLEGTPSTYPPRQAGIVMNAWASIIGFLMVETFGSLSTLIQDPDQLFDAHVRTVLLGMGFRPELVTP